MSKNTTAEGIRVLLNAAQYLKDRNFPFNFNTMRAISILNECAVKTLATTIYMRHGYRIDRDQEGILGLYREADYYVTSDGGLIRLHHD